MNAKNEQRLKLIRTALETHLSPSEIEVIDESHLHAGHAGAQSGLGHFRLRVVAKAFEGLSLIKRHRLVYAALGDLMQTDIHALSINALSDVEARS